VAEGALGALAGPGGSRASPPPAAAAGQARGLEVHVVDRPGSVQTALSLCRPTLLRGDPSYPATLLANHVWVAGRPRVSSAS